MSFDPGAKYFTSPKETGATFAGRPGSGLGSVYHPGGLPAEAEGESAAGSTVGTIIVAGVAMVMSVATAVVFTIAGRSGANPGVAGATVVAVADDAVDPVNGAAAVIVGNAGAFAGGVVGFGGGDGSERAKAKDGGEEERAEFHDFRGVDCLFVF